MMMELAQIQFVCLVKNGVRLVHKEMNAHHVFQH
jgi:hypothetical protein